MQPGGMALAVNLSNIINPDYSYRRDGYCISPAILDAVFQSCMFFITDELKAIIDYDTRDFYLPSAVQSIVIHGQLTKTGAPDTVLAHITLVEWKPGE
jgi:hypothetical protein